MRTSSMKEGLRGGVSTVGWDGMGWGWLERGAYDDHVVAKTLGERDVVLVFAGGSFDCPWDVFVRDSSA